MHNHQSGFEVVGRIPRFQQEVIRAEVGLWGVTGDWARAHGGPVVRAFVEALPASWQGQDYRVRCKLNWLKRGWVPGGSLFHSDMAGRRSDGELEHAVTPLPGKHTIGCVAGDCSLTLFVTGPVALPEYPLGQPQGLLYDATIRDRLAAGTLEARRIEEGALILFGLGDFHDAQPAAADGWRLFLRATLHHDPGDAPTSADPQGGPPPWMQMRSGYEPQSAVAERLFAPYRSQRRHG